MITGYDATQLGEYLLELIDGKYDDDITMIPTRMRFQQEHDEAVCCAVCERTKMTPENWKRLSAQEQIPWLQSAINVYLLQQGAQRGSDGRGETTGIPESQPEGKTSDPPVKPDSSPPFPPEGTKFSEDNAPDAFREGGKPGAAVLTTPYLKAKPKWELLGPYLNKNYGPGKTLTTHIKVGRAKAYLFQQLTELRRIKTANEAKREREELD